MKLTEAKLTPRAAYRFPSSTDGLELAVQSWGAPRGKPIVLVHAWSQSHLSWSPVLLAPQLAGHHLITFDLRGHGESGKDNDASRYAGDARWGQDLHDVISQLELENVTLVGWSMGSLIALDYLSQYGDKRISALNLVAGVNASGNARAQTQFGAAAAQIPDALGNALAPHLSAMLKLQQALVLREISIEDFGQLYAQSLVAHPAARAGLLSRTVDHEATLRAWHKPLLLTHGDSDEIALLAAAEQAKRFASHAMLSLYQGAGHAPHWEDPERFALELDALVQL
jgi:non-heme chloroperoxidase